jgi:amino acid adenylation domain-containing protein
MPPTPADRLVSTARSCHSLVRRGITAELAVARLPGATDLLTGAGPAAVWVVTSGDMRDGPAAARLREVERGRPLAHRAALRCVLLRHVDDTELVLVADRSRVAYCCLVALASIATEGGTPPGIAEHLAAAAHYEPVEVPSPPRPGGRVYESPLSEPIALDRDDLVAALGSLCAEVLGREDVTVAVEEPGGKGLTDELAGVIMVDGTEDFLPVLAPPCPITVIGYRAGDGTVRVRTWADSDEIDADVAETVATQLVRRLRTAKTTGFHLLPAEVAKILQAGQSRPPVVDEVPSIGAAFAAVAGSRPDRVAVTGDGGVLTYGELGQQSRDVAAALIAAGVTAGERVGVCMERTPRAVVALLGVLLAGACYVPLDPGHPPARRAYMAEDAGLRLIIADLDDWVDGPAAVRVVPLDELLAGTVAGSLPDVDPDTPAYVIYTSGTTGHPKGTVVPHRNVLALIAATRREFALSAGDVWTVFHSLAFDFSVWEIWGCLLTGGRLVTVPYWTARTPALFAQLLRDERVTVLSQTPSAFANLVPAVLPGAAGLDVRLVIFGGEALRPAVLIDWVRRFPLADCRLVNMYGITETTVHVTWHDITAVDIETNGRSVGRPLPGWSVSVRSADGRVVPFGAIGEIYVGGAGLALGYHERPELTAQRFPVDPGTGERHYRSGDRGRLRPDGTLEHLGRVDDQVKVRGHRVEPAEIHAALLTDPAVRDAVVRFHDNGEGGAIHAYLVTRSTSVSDIRNRLRAGLPEYMVPEELYLVAEFPLTPNGKVDMAALAASAGNAVPAPVPVPQDAADLPAAVRRIWADVLNAQESELDLDFFDLGGSSLQALKVSLALGDLGYPGVGPQDVYLNPSIADLVAYLRRDWPCAPANGGSRSHDDERD